MRVSRLACAPREAKIGRSASRTGAGGWVSGRQLLRHSLLVVILLGFATPAYAQPDTFIALPAKEAARLVARDAELDAVQAQVAALEAVVAAQARHIDAQAKVIALQDEEIARRERITALADEEAAIHQGRAARIERDAKKGNLWLRVQARAGAGALIGAAAAPMFPPAALLGPAAGALVGLVEHWIAD